MRLTHAHIRRCFVPDAFACARALAAAGEDEKKASGVKEYIDIYGDLRSR